VVTSGKQTIVHERAESIGPSDFAVGNGIGLFSAACAKEPCLAVTRAAGAAAAALSCVVVFKVAESAQVAHTQKSKQGSESKIERRGSEGEG
jgi:hypothetical protein